MKALKVYSTSVRPFAFIPGTDGSAYDLALKIRKMLREDGCRMEILIEEVEDFDNSELVAKHFKLVEAILEAAAPAPTPDPDGDTGDATDEQPAIWSQS